MVFYCLEHQEKMMVIFPLEKNHHVHFYDNIIRLYNWNNCYCDMVLLFQNKTIFIPRICPSDGISWTVSNDCLKFSGGCEEFYNFNPFICRMECPPHKQAFLCQVTVGYSSQILLLLEEEKKKKKKSLISRMRRN